MALSKPFQHQPSSLASYSWSDIEAGTGIVNYYCTVGKDGSGFTYYLNEAAYNSWLIETFENTTGTKTYTFDSGEFNSPRLIDGTAFFSCSVEEAAGAASVSAQLFKWDGTTATAMTAKISSGTMSGAEERNIYLEIPITTRTQIKQGEQIRLVVELILTGNDATYIGHSPTNQTSPTAKVTDTRMIVGVPFVIDI